MLQISFSCIKTSRLPNPITIQLGLGIVFLSEESQDSFLQLSHTTAGINLEISKPSMQNPAD